MFLTLWYRDTIQAVTEFYQTSDVFVWKTHVSISIRAVEEIRPNFPLNMILRTRCSGENIELVFLLQHIQS